MVIIAAIVAIIGGIGTAMGAVVAWRSAGSTNRQTNAQIDREQLERMKSWQEKADKWREKAERDIDGLKSEREQDKRTIRHLVTHVDEWRSWWRHGATPPPPGTPIELSGILDPAAPPMD